MIFLIDTIGKETGMHLYDIAFRNIFKQQNKDVIVLSNFSESSSDEPFFENFYYGSKLTKITKLLKGIFKFAFFYTQHKKNNIFVYQSFGLRIIDILFIILFCGSKSLYIVVHDLFEITNKNGKDNYLKIKLWIYHHLIHNVICHSEETAQAFRTMGWKGRICYYPHFSYDFNKTIDHSQINFDIINTISETKPNFLFFGQLRDSKGIEILKDAIIALKENEFDEANIIIAGQDKQGLMTDFKTPDFVKIVCRYISDNELNYLFDKCQYVLLPYKEIYQSGVLEVVVYFQIHAIMSDIPYFCKFLQKYPSFGSLYSPNSGIALSNAIKQLTQNKITISYSKTDICKYKKDHDIAPLIQFIR